MEVVYIGNTYNIESNEAKALDSKDSNGADSRDSRDFKDSKTLGSSIEGDFVTSCLFLFEYSGGDLSSCLIDLLKHLMINFKRNKSDRDIILKYFNSNFMDLDSNLDSNISLESSPLNSAFLDSSDVLDSKSNLDSKNFKDSKKNLNSSKNFNIYIKGFSSDIIEFSQLLSNNIPL